MRLKAILQIPILLFLFGLGLSAQSNIIPGEILVQVRENASIEAITKDLGRLENRVTRARVSRHVSQNAGIWKISFDYKEIAPSSFLAAAQAHRGVLIAQYNHQMELRATTPNDNNFDQQWQYINNGDDNCTAGADLDAELAWDETTGGLTATGDTIVLAVIDDGLDPNHLDFAGNLWKNYAEIPENGIDDDGNGYIDDYHGWDVENNDDSVLSGGGHGTPVAGIMGARGNNGIGVTGVNWVVKLMILQGGPPEDDAIASYDYILTMRKKWNQSAGAEGAFVVASNSSWGIDNANPDNYPLWCAMYDAMGEEGLLSCGATANVDTNVDLDGDMPTGCSSEFLISVTNIGCDDQKINAAGYGTTTIDLGSYGNGAYTTAVGNNYGGFGGTSGATPHVTGMVGLLYSVDCMGLAELAKAQPANAARLVRDYILDGVKPNASLDGISVTGGHLNMNNSIQLALTECPPAGQCLAPYAINISNIQTDQITINWSALSSADGFSVQYRPLGGTWTTVSSNSPSTTITGLSSCTDYELQLGATCMGNTGDFSDIIPFTTDGCCLPPNILSILPSANGTTATWQAVTAATTYNLQITEAWTGNWFSIENLNTNSYEFTQLEICKAYQVRLQSTCGGENAPYGDPVLFYTECGACTAQNYCQSRATNATDEWIDSVQIGDYLNASGANDGYAHFISAGIPLTTNETYNFTFTPGYANSAYSEYFVAWIDYNQDGDFNDVLEEVYNAGNATSGPVSGTFQVPPSALAGITRMRISMQFDSPAGSCLNSFQYGEVEDYCVFIDFSVNNDDILSGQEVRLGPNPFDHSIMLDFNLKSSGKVTYNLLNIAGQEVVQGDFGLLPSGQQQEQVKGLGNLPAGIYFLRLKTVDGFVVRKLVKG